MKNNILKVMFSIIIVLILGLSSSLVSAAPCTFDYDLDGDVDGNDLVAFMSSGNPDYASFASEFGKTDCSIGPTNLLTDTDFEASADTADLLADGPGRDWYESRGDTPTQLFLDETDVGGNSGKKAGFSGSSSGNAYVSQEFESAKSGKFAVQWDIYVDAIVNISSSVGQDRTGWMMIGDDSLGTDGPNSTNDERFVILAFYKNGGGSSGTMDLVARDRDDGWSSFTTVAAGLDMDNWYKITVMCDLDTDTYDVYVNGEFKATLTSRVVKDSLTHISFATWSDGAGSFYVDNVQEVSLATVPNCVGLAEADARVDIVTAGLVAGTATTEYHATIGTGNVISVTPAEDTQVPLGSTVDLVVSLGPAPISVPDVVGNDEATAVSAIEAEGFVANVGYAYDAVVTAGLVISQDPAGGTSVSSGSTVDIVVSLGPAPTNLLTDTDFEASADTADLLADGPGRDWYESRGDTPTQLFLDETDVGGNSGKKAGFSGSSSGNAYVSQEFESAKSGKFAVQWDIYVDAIVNISSSVGQDRTGWMMIGDDSLGTDGPNSTNDERFVILAFYKNGGGSSGTMDLVARDRDDGWSSFTTVAAGLDMDNWYKITVMCDLDTDTYDVYVNGEFKATLTSRVVKDSLTHISFATWSDGAGSFYVDNVQEVSLATVPNCVGLAEADARADIVTAGLVAGTATTEYHATIGTGNVISVTPAEDTQVPLGSTVDLVVSLGPAPISVPDVVGNDEATAVNAIEAQGLVANVSYAYDAVAAGLVISQDPAGGTPASPGDSVNLVVSLGADPSELLTESDFETILGTDELRADGPGRDWYESRQDGTDGPKNLSLDETNVGDNSGKKAKFKGSATLNTYMSQELKTPQSGVFSLQWDIYVDEILDISQTDRSGFMFIGDDSDNKNGPNSTGNDRFVYLAFYKEGGGVDGPMDLMAVEPDGTTMVAEGLSLDQWYTIKVLCDVPNNTYMVYVDGVFQKALTAFKSKTSLTHISFATWNDGAGSFYVDNVMEVASVMHTLTIGHSDNGTVTLSPLGGVYPEGSLVTMFPVPDAGWLFNEWDGDLLGGANPAKITMDSDMTITPVFIEAPWVAMHVAPTLLDFGSDTTVLNMDVKNNGEVPFDWTANADQPWVTDISPRESTLDPHQSFNLTVTIDRNRIGAALPDNNCRMWGAIGTPLSGLPSDVVTSDLYTDPNSLWNLTKSYNEEGWGIAYYNEFGGVPVIARGPIQAYLDPNYITAVNAAGSAQPRVAITHVRNCTSGCCVNLGADIDDPHPFYRQKNGKTWLFEHNGSINKTSLKNLIGEAYLAANPPNGSGIPLCDPDDPDLVVDSELYFLLVLKNIEANNWSVEKGIIETASLSLIRSSTSNFIMTDGYTIWALRSGETLAFYHDPSGYSVVASEPPNGSAGWTTMSDNELVILRPGQAPQLINVLNFYDNKYIGTIYLDNTLGESVDVQVTAEGPEGVQVPDVVGKTQTEAAAEFTAAGLTLGGVTIDYSVAVPPDTVIYSDPPAGSFVVVGSAVNCVMNLGPVIVDNTDPYPATEYEGTWPVSSGVPHIGDDNWYSSDNGDTFTWYWTPPISTNFDVEEWHTVAGTRTTNARYDIEHDNGGGTRIVTTVYPYNQKINGGKWNLLGSFRFEAGVTYAVTLTASGSGSTCADAVRFKKTGILRHKFTTTLPGGGQIMPVMGDIDNDGVQEIVMAAGGRIIAVNGKTGVIEWSVSGGTDTAVELVDLNNDGTPEILHAMSGPRVRALNGNGTVRWTSAVLKGDWMPMFPIIALDITGDGLPEIYFAGEDSHPDPYSGNINDYNGALTMLNSNGIVQRDTWIHHPCWGGMSIADVNHDNEFEIYLGDRREGYHNFPAKGIQAFNARTLAPLWDRPDIHHSSSIPMLADVTKDGFLDVVATKITLAGPMILDPITGGTISDYSNRNLPTHGTPTVYDIDEDGNLEYICSTSYPASAPKKFVVFDLVKGTVDFEDYLDFWITWSPSVGDVTGDGHKEILVATGDQEEEVGDNHNGSYPLIVYDKNFNMIDWVDMPQGTGQLTPAKVYDTDGDGFNEVVVAGFNGYLMVYDTDAPTPNPAPRSWIQYYSEYRRGAAEYVPPPTPGP